MILARYPPTELIQRRQRVVRAIGFEAGEERRSYKHVVKAIGLDATEEHRRTWARSPSNKTKRPSRQQWLDEHYFAYWYPLMDWLYDRERCKRIIADAGLPVPIKSACFFCLANRGQRSGQAHVSERTRQILRLVNIPFSANRPSTLAIM